MDIFVPLVLVKIYVLVQQPAQATTPPPPQAVEPVAGGAAEHAPPARRTSMNNCPWSCIAPAIPTPKTAPTTKPAPTITTAPPELRRARRFIARACISALAF